MMHGTTNIKLYSEIFAVLECFAVWFGS